jgi:hypothetical protein
VAAVATRIAGTSRAAIRTAACRARERVGFLIHIKETNRPAFNAQLSENPELFGNSPHGLEDADDVGQQSARLIRLTKGDEPSAQLTFILAECEKRNDFKDAKINMMETSGSVLKKNVVSEAIATVGSDGERMITAHSQNEVEYSRMMDKVRTETVKLEAMRSLGRGRGRPRGK